MLVREEYIPKRRRGDHLKEVRTILEAWRLKVKREYYSPSPFTAAAVLPDPVLKILASNGIGSVLDIPLILKNTGWIFLDRHGQEVLDVVHHRDLDILCHREEVKRARLEKQRQATEARRQERSQQRDREREEARAEKERKRVIAQLEKDVEKARRKRLRDEASAAKKADAAAQSALQRAARALRTLPLEGSTVFNVTPQTPLPPRYQTANMPLVTPSPVYTQQVCLLHLVLTLRSIIVSDIFYVQYVPNRRQ